MKATRVGALLGVVFVIQTGISFAAADYLDRLSGPGGFWGLTAGYRFLCVSRAQDQDDYRALPLGGVSASGQMVDEGRTIFTLLSPIDRGSGLLPIRRPVDPGSFKRPSDDVDATRIAVARYRNDIAKRDCMRDERLRGYFTLTTSIPGSQNGKDWHGPWYESEENGLLISEADRESDDFQVNIYRLTMQYSVRVTPFLDVGAGVGYARFFGKKFDTFSRPFGIPLLIEVSAPEGHDRLRGIKLGVGLYWFGNFTEEDFCTQNGSTTECAAFKDFKTTDELGWRASLIFDLSSIWPTGLTLPRR